MATQRGAEDARNHLPELLDAAEKGHATIITKRGRPVAALVPVEAYKASERQPSLLPLYGSGRGYWGEDSARAVRELRDEWDSDV
jgi:prevent-host-death family protein